MPRGRLVIPKDDLEAIRLFTENHIVQVRRGTSGRITEVDHVQFGWMKPERYYQLQMLQNAMPLIGKVIEGGYRMKAAIWSRGILAGSMMATALSFYGIHRAAGKNAEAVLDIAALFLPFGELWHLYLLASTVEDVFDEAKEELKKRGGPLVKWWEDEKGLDDAIEVIASFFESIFGKEGPIFGRP